MKHVDIVRACKGTLLFFCIGLLLDRYGPFADDRSLASSAIRTAIASVFFGLLMAWGGQFAKKPTVPVVLDDDAAARVDALLAKGKDVAAVKAVRDATGAGLVQAKATVDARR